MTGLKEFQWREGVFHGIRCHVKIGGTKGGAVKPDDGDHQKEKERAPFFQPATEGDLIAGRVVQCRRGAVYIRAYQVLAPTRRQEQFWHLLCSRAQVRPSRGESASLRF